MPAHRARRSAVAPIKQASYATIEVAVAAARGALDEARSVGTFTSELHEKFYSATKQLFRQWNAYAVEASLIRDKIVFEAAARSLDRDDTIVEYALKHLAGDCEGIVDIACGASPSVAWRLLARGYSGAAVFLDTYPAALAVHASCLRALAAEEGREIPSCWTWICSDAFDTVVPGALLLCHQVFPGWRAGLGTGQEQPPAGVTRLITKAQATRATALLAYLDNHAARTLVEAAHRLNLDADLVPGLCCATWITDQCGTAAQVDLQP